MTNDIRNRLNKIIDDHNLNIGHAQPYDLKDQSYFRVIDAILAKLDPDALAHPVRVKPLVWNEYPTGTWRAATAFNAEYVIKQEGNVFWLEGRVLRKRFGALEAAQAAAQADYGSRILAALEPAEAPGPDALIVAAIEAERDQAMQEALSLARSLHKTHYSDVTQWEPLDYPAGIISQIDNMVAGIVTRAEAAEAKLAVAETYVARMAKQNLHVYEADWQEGFFNAVVDARATLAQLKGTDQ